MPDENNATVAATPPVSEQPPKSGLQTLNEEIAQGIKNSPPKVREAVVSKLVAEEVTKRTGQLEKLMVALNAARKESFKIKPDIQTYNADRTLASEGWSKAALDKKQKFDEKFAKAEKAFEKALNDGDYSQVEQSIKDLQAAPDAKKEDKADEKA